MRVGCITGREKSGELQRGGSTYASLSSKRFSASFHLLCITPLYTLASTFLPPPASLTPFPGLAYHEPDRPHL